jgi:hypothetical protein
MTIRAIGKQARLMAFAVSAAAAMAAANLEAQPQRPKATVTPSAPATVAAGREVTLTLTVTLPGSIHVQSDKPRDAALIATVLTLDPPPGVTVNRIEYPPAEDLVQAGQSKPLAVFGPAFTIAVRVTVASSVAGQVSIPATLRYQACDVSVCYPPARAPVTWTTTAAATM